MIPTASLTNQFEKKILPSSESRVVADSEFLGTSVLVSHFAYTSCKRVESMSTMLIDLQFQVRTDSYEYIYIHTYIEREISL